VNANRVFAGVYLLVIGGVVALIGALLGPQLRGDAQFALVIGGFSAQAVGVATAVTGTWMR
jgi:hypothetical protein